ECPNFSDSHLGIARDRRMLGKTTPLPLACADHPLAHALGGFTRFLAGQLLEFDTLNLHVHINAVQDRAAQSFLVARHHRLRTTARPRLVAVKSTGTPMRSL